MNKTVKRKTVVDATNRAMSSDWLSAEEKLAIATFASNILIASKSYNGYTVDTDAIMAEKTKMSVEDYMRLPLASRKLLEVSSWKFF